MDILCCALLFALLATEGIVMIRIYKRLMEEEELLTHESVFKMFKATL